MLARLEDIRDGWIVIDDCTRSVNIQDGECLPVCVYTDGAHSR